MRNAIHAILAVLLWIVFVVYWAIVVRRPMNPDTKTALISLAVLSFLAMAYLTFWVFHNIRISKRYGRRQKRRRPEREPIQDFLGRWVVVDQPDTMRMADYIEVEVRTSTVDQKQVEEKIFRRMNPLE